MDKVEAVRCDYCGKLMEVGSGEYMNFIGFFVDVTDKDFDVDDACKEKVVCKTRDCMRKLIEKHTGVSMAGKTKLDEIIEEWENDDAVYKQINIPCDDNPNSFPQENPEDFPYVYFHGVDMGSGM